MARTRLLKPFPPSISELELLSIVALLRYQLVCRNSGNHWDHIKRYRRLESATRDPTVELRCRIDLLLFVTLDSAVWSGGLRLDDIEKCDLCPAVEVEGGFFCNVLRGGGTSW